MEAANLRERAGARETRRAEAETGGGAVRIGRVPRRNDTRVCYTACMPKERKKLLIIDGYNVLRSGPRYRSIAGPDYTDDAFNKAREALINDVVNYAGRDYSAIIVFDGGGNEYSQGKTQTVAGIRIMFSPAGSSADKVIEKLAHDARERMIETLVVTSDATIQNTVFGDGIDRMSAPGFCHEVGAYYEDARLDEQPKVAKKNTIAARIDPETLAKLIALRDGS